MKCLGCGKGITGDAVKVDGGSVRDTAGMRRKSPEFWHKSCWDENVKFNEESRRKFAEETERIASRIISLSKKCDPIVLGHSGEDF